MDFFKKPDDCFISLLHVDDALFVSTLVCTPCLFAVVQKIYPDDIHFDLEGSGPQFTYLNTNLHFLGKKTTW